MDKVLRHVGRNRWILWAWLCFVLPMAAWAPDSRVDLGVTEVTINFQVLYHAETLGEAEVKYGGLETFNEKRAADMVDALNAKLSAHGLRFNFTLNEVFDPNAYSFGKNASRMAILKRLERYAAPGAVTVVVPYKVSTAAAFSNQFLDAGPFAVIPKEAHSGVLAEQIGFVFGFTKNCLSEYNIMYRSCIDTESNGDELESDATYFTVDKVAQYYPGLLGEWKRRAKMHLTQVKLSRAKKDKLLSWRQELPNNGPQTTRPYLPQTP